MKKFLGSSYFVFMLLLLYIPILVMMVFSFNSGSSVDIFSGWSGKWYTEFFHNSPFLKSIVTSLFVAVTSTIISIIVGMMAVIGLRRLPRRRRSIWLGITNIPLINADVITAVSLMVIFLLAGIKFGIVTLIAAHISFNIPYVIITVLPFARRIDRNLIKASQDLGSSEVQTLFKVILPILRPAIITAIFICFAMSFDDFIISYFTSGVLTNVSTFIYTAKRVQPYINAFGTLLVTTLFLSILIWNIIRFVRQKIQDDKIKIKNGEYKLKKIKKIMSKIEAYQAMIDSETKIVKTRSMKLWLKYYMLKSKLRYLKGKNYNARISKLEWRKELINQEIRSEKRILRTHESALHRQNILKTQVDANPNSSRAQRFLNAIDKLDKKITKLEKEIEWINERRENEKEKVESLGDMIDELKTEMSNTTDLSKKDRQWYLKRINYYNDKRNIFLEGKNKYKLRVTIEKLATLRSNNLEAIQNVYEKITTLEEKLFIHIPLTKKIDIKINKLVEDDAKKSQDLIIKREVLLIVTKESLEWKIAEQNEYLKMVDIEKEKKYQKYFIQSESGTIKNKSWIQRSWKGVTLVTLIAISFSGLTTAYVLNNSYDIVVGNWGSYIDMGMIREFEKANGVKINYQQYDSNESLYNKNKTMNYDVMVPSDYMVQRMAQEDSIEKIDWTKIDHLQNPEISEIIDGKDKVNETLSNIWALDDNKLIMEHALPYFWGDVRVVVNLDSAPVKTFLDNEKISYTNGKLGDFNWSFLWDAANDGLRVDLSDDAKNLFMIGSKSLGFDVTPQEAQVETVKDKLMSLVKKRNVSLLGDQLISQIGDGRFDIAVGYNGDILYGEQTYMDLKGLSETQIQQSFVNGVPTEGTNIWSDNMVINKRNRNKNLSYKFVNYIIDNAARLGEYTGYSVGPSNAMNSLLNGVYSAFTDLYQPSNNPKNGAFIYNKTVDDKIVNAYNEIIESKIGG